MRERDFVLGIDTSNYTTSLAVTDKDGSIIGDSRKLLIVKQGERGLRQSHALFQHMENIPDLIRELFEKIDKSRIGAVAASGRPRPVEGSYMPVFKAGVNYGKAMAAAFGVPFFEFSHQEGHLAAAVHGSGLSQGGEYLAYHLSGGTCELLHVTASGDGQRDFMIKILGGSRDLSFGQVLDRIGVALGIPFPAGKEMDLIAVETGDKLRQESLRGQRGERFARVLKEIPIDGLEINLSGIETQCRRELEKGANREALIHELFEKISVCLCRLTEKAVSQTGCNRVLFAGGVSASRFVRQELSRYFCENSMRQAMGTAPSEKVKTDLIFADPVLASDNAVGIALLGGKRLWQSNR